MTTGQRLRIFVSALCVLGGPAGLFHESVAFAGEGQNEQQSDSTAEARKQFQAGVNLLDDPDGARYEEALFAFRKAYELSRSPKILGNIGFCAMHLERDGEAIEAYTEYLNSAPSVDERERAQIQKDLSTLTWTSAKFHATVKDKGKFVLVDTRIVGRGNPVVNSYPFEGTELTVRLRPGRHSFKIQGGQNESVPFEMGIEPASENTHRFTFPTTVLVEPPSQPSRPSLVGPIALGTAGLVAIGAGVITGIMARSKASDIDSNCPNDTCPRSYDLDSNRSSVNTLSTVADVSLIGGGVMLGGAVVWYVIQSKSHSRQMGNTQQKWISGGCAGSGCGIQLRGRF
ncbi:hypothetical protein LVJ94_33710 [Pendulispora rubella]|uniref:PEGA domain-containing protein n=1 Tax=Pendulispora rubella TaxID=2741070 RepID=A0ABZ2KTL6_9BACT